MACQPTVDKGEIQDFVTVKDGYMNDEKYKPWENGLNRLMDKFHIPGMLVIVAKNDTVIYKKGFGFADIENKILATSRTPYRIASLTKPISSTILLQLRGKGRLSLQDTIKNFVSEYETIASQHKQT